MLALLLLTAPAGGFRPLFDGTSLAGWVPVNVAADTFAVRGGAIVTTGSPTGYMRSEKPYENFELEFEWTHTRPAGMANSGLFVWGDPLPAVGTGYTRGIEVQVLNNYEADWATSHGDLFSIWGARCTPDRPHPKGIERCLPSERRCKGPGYWNHYRVVGDNGRLTLAVNGKVVSGVSGCSPRKGYLALESEGSECHFRNLRIKELPTTDPAPLDVADEAAGHRSLFDGLTLAGLTGDGWTARDGVLACKAAATLSAAPSAVGEVVFDYKLPKGAGYGLTVRAAGATLELAADGRVTAATGPAGDARSYSPRPGKAGDWHRVRLAAADGRLVASVDGRTAWRVLVPGPAPAAAVEWAAGGPAEVRNLFVKEAGK
jgi:hypothetical protein